MISGGRYPSEEMELKQTHAKIRMWIIIIMIVFGLTWPPVFTMAAPVIVDEDSGGNWTDSFEDDTGIVTFNNTTVENGDVSLEPGIYIFDDFDDETVGTTPSTWYLTSPITTSEVINTDSVSTPNCYYTLENNAADTEYACRDFNNPGFDIITFEFDFIPVNIYTQIQAWSGPTLVSKFDGGFGGGPNGLRYKDQAGWHDTGYDVDPNAWSHYIAVYDTTNGYLDFYVNGTQFVDNGELLENGLLIDGFRFWYNLDRTYEFKIDNLRIFAGNPTTEGNIVSENITLPNGQSWERLVLSKTENRPETYLNITIIDATTGQPISGFENLSGTDIDISLIDPFLYPVIALKADFSGNITASPLLHEWTVKWKDVTPPGVPLGLDISNPHTGYSLILIWEPNPEPDFDGYVLYFSTDNATFYWLSNVSSKTVSLIHYGLSLGTTYFYKIAAADEVPNQSPFSDVVEGVPDLDYDGDGIGNLIDPDDDNDGIPDIDDPYPYSDINDMEVTLDNLTLDIDTLRIWLETVMVNVQTNINTTNNTLHQQLAIQDALMTSFYDRLTSDIGDIQSDLQLHDQNTGQDHSDIIALLGDVLDGQIEKEKITELRTMLVDLAENLSDHDQSIADDILGVVDDIDLFETQTDDQLQMINQTLMQLEQLEAILGDLEALDRSLDQAEEDIQDSIDERSTKDEDEERFFVLELLLVIVLILLVLILLSILLTRKTNKQGGESPAQESIQEVRDEVVQDRKIPPRPPLNQSKS